MIGDAESLVSKRKSVWIPFPHLTFGVALFDKELHCLAFSAVPGRMNGVSVEEPAGRPIDQLFPEGSLRLVPAIRQVWHTGNAVSDIELAARSSDKSGELVWRISLLPIKDESGEVRLVAVTFSDVTKRRSVPVKNSRLREEKQKPFTGNDNRLGEEFADLSARAFELARHSVELLKNSVASRHQTLEVRIEAAREGFALFLNGIHVPEVLSDSAGPNGNSGRAAPNGHDAIEESKLAANGNCPSPRERQILFQLAEGKSNKEIASILNISTRTVECYRARIMQKLGLHSTAALVRYAIRNHIVEL